MKELPKFLILGQDRKRKGNNFEKFLNRFLRTQGYIDIELNYRRTGMEVDIKGKHGITKIELFGEAKGYNDKTRVATKEVNAFKTKYDSYISRKKLSIGDCTPIFITTTDFSWETWELNEREDEPISSIRLVNDKKLLNLLQKTEWIPSNDYIDSKIVVKIPFKTVNKYIVIYEGDLYWLYIFKNGENKVSFYAIFENNDQILSHNKALKIIELLPESLKSLTYIDLDIQFKILGYLITNERCSRQEISSTLGYSLESIDLNLKILNKQEKIIQKTLSEEFILSNEYEWFRIIFNLIYTTKSKSNLLVKLFLSDYFKKVLNTKTINHILTRFNIIELEQPAKDELKLILSLYPGALNYCLNEQEDLIFFKKIPGSNAIQRYETLKFKLFAKISEDIFKNRKILKPIFTENKILDERISGKITLLKEKRLFLDFIADGTFSYIKLTPNIKKLELGTPITFVDKHGFIGLTSSLIEFRNYEGAIKKCDELLSNPDFSEQKYGFLINKGVALNRLERYSDAIECYEEVLKLGKEIPLIYRNLIHAWENKYTQAINKQKDFPLIIGSLLDYLLKAKENLNHLKKADLDSEKSRQMESVEEIERDLEKKFEEYFNLSIKMLDDTQIPSFLSYVLNKDVEFIKILYNNHKGRIDSVANK